jgi:hypothetical protein
MTVNRWVGFAIALLSGACLVQTTATPTPIIEIPLEVPYVEPTGTPGCQPVLEVTLEVRRTDTRSVWLQASGLQPGERPRIIYGASAKGEEVYGEMGEFRVGADERGEFTYALNGLELGTMALDGPYTATWDIRLIHARGVACASITLP